MPPPARGPPLNEGGDGDDNDEAATVTFGLSGSGGQPRHLGGAAAGLQSLDASCRQLTALPPGIGAGGGGERLRELTLAFNALSSLEGLPQACPCLERLNASHNRLHALPDLSSLLMLTRLDCGHNRLGSLRGVEGCAALVELWAAHNRLPLCVLLELVPLASLSLRNLVLGGNPCAMCNALCNAV